LYRKSIYIFILFCISSFCFGNDHVSYIIFYSPEQKVFYENYFTFKKIEYHVDENCIGLILNNESLTNIILVEYLKQQIIKDNIENINTTRTSMGGPYKRKYLEIDITDGITIIEDYKDGRLMYDPLHPDAIRNGERKGYVLYPNIDIESEYKLLFESVQLFNSIVEYIHINNIGIIVEKVSMSTLEELHHFIKIEKQLDMYFKYLFEEIHFIQRDLIINNYDDDEILKEFMEKINERENIIKNLFRIDKME
jgi:flagellar basal body rod protein FlgC